MVRTLTDRAVLTISSVGVSYLQPSGRSGRRRFWALEDVSFEVFRGETLGIIGRNGVGKSTLLRLLAGIIAPDRGEIRNHGVSVSLLSLQAGFINYLTGRENVILSGMMLGLSRRSILARMDEIEEYADIGGFFDQPVKSYSAGMRARVGFSIAIHVGADVILLDEVLGVGDIDFRAKSSATIREMMNSERTVVLVSHLPGLIKEVCNRVIWIDKGRVVQVGEPGMVLEQYRNAYS